MAEKKDVVVSRTDPKIRAEIEAKRGIVRDEDGKILRSKEWKKNRLVRLQAKLDDFKNRTKNAEAEIKQLKKDLGK